MHKKPVLILLFILIFPGCAHNFTNNSKQADLVDDRKDVIVIDLHSKQLGTYYAVLNIDGVGNTEVMVDTGAGYSTINEVTLFKLLEQEKAKHEGKLIGIMADGTELEIPVFSITVQIGTCTLKNVEVAVFPNDTRMLLGLSALGRFPSFKFDVRNLTLIFPYCPR